MNKGVLRKTRCSSNHTHTAGSRKCKDCNRLVQAVCNVCGEWKASASISDHEKRCKKKTVPGVPVVVRVAYVSPTMERGSYFFEDEDEFRASASWLERRNVTDEAIGGYVINSYDAVFAQLEADHVISVVECFKKTTSVIKCIKEKKRLDADVLVWPNWMFECGATDLNGLVQWVESLRQFECVCRCKVVPPIDYCQLFGRKELWTSRMLQLEKSSKLFKMIPTHVVFDMLREVEVKSFAKEHSTDRLVFKRSLSEASKHVTDNVSIGKKRLKGVPKDVGPFPYLVQPFVEEFTQYPEMRVYVLDGSFFFGVQSRWVGGEIEFKPLDDWDHMAVKAAIEVASAIPEASKFVRIDLVQSNQDNKLWLNEIEFFGSADLLFPVVGGQRDLLKKLASSIKSMIHS